MAYVDAYSDLEEFEDGEKPWCDMVFDLTEVQVIGKKGWFGKDPRVVRGVAMATTPRGDIGFAFETAPVAEWTPGQGGSIPIAWGRVAVRSVGEPTDRLLAEYEAWWDQPKSDLAVVQELWCQAVLLAETPDALVQRPVGLKLFFQGEEDVSSEDESDDKGDDERYAELFFNLDVGARRAALREKDPDYREGITKFLSGQIPSGMMR